MHPFWTWIILVIAVLAVGAVIANRREIAEMFEDGVGGVETHIIDVYQDTLDRQPNSKELIADTRAVQAGELTFPGLRQRLIDSKEYAQRMKLQTNELAPELDKVIADRQLFQTIQALYRRARRAELPGTLLLPYRDIYIYLNYNDDAFRAFLMSDKYTEFEKDLLRSTETDPETLLASLTSRFGTKKEMLAAGAKLRAAEEAAGAAAAGPAPAVVGEKIAAAAGAGSGTEDMKISSVLKRVLEGTNGTLDKDAQARILDEIEKIQNDPTLSPEEKRQAMEAILSMANQDAVNQATASAVLLSRDNTDYLNVPTHEGDMVLRPEMAWAVPQRRPPVCTGLGQPALVQPLYTNSKLLLGTPLGKGEMDLIMPKFRYQEYATVPVRRATCPPAPAAGEVARSSKA